MSTQNRDLKKLLASVQACVLVTLLACIPRAHANSTTDPSRASINALIAIPVTLIAGTSQFFKDAVQPTELKFDAYTRPGARVTKANISFDDHPGELRWSDRIRTVTVDSVFSFIANRDPDAIRIVLALQQ